MHYAIGLEYVEETMTYRWGNNLREHTSNTGEGFWGKHDPDHNLMNGNPCIYIYFDTYNEIHGRLADGECAFSSHYACMIV